MKNGKKRVHEYTAFFEANEHGGYTVTVPSMPGLVTEGRHFDYARSMASDVIQCYIDGLENASSV
jgi:antitoxin HicB